MDKKSHSPSPWEVGKEMMSEFPIFVKSGIAHCVAVAFTREDADLIAVAPELLSFVEFLANGATGDGPEPADLLAQAQALVARARPRR